MFSRFTASARRVMQRAFREAKRSQHDFVGTQHLLFGLLCDADGPAVTLLRSLHAAPEKILDIVEASLAQHGDDAAMEKFPLSPASRRVFQSAVEEAGRFGHQMIGPEHLLLGLLHVEDCEAAQILFARGIDFHAVRAAIERLPPDTYREAQIRAGDQVPAPDGDNPSAEELERWIAPPAAASDSVAGPVLTPGVSDPARAMEIQLRLTQFVLAAVTGYAFGHWLGGWNIGVAVALGTCVLASMQKSWVGILFGMCGGFWLTLIFRVGSTLPATHILMGVLGGFLGSFLGDAWRFPGRAPGKQPAAPEATAARRESPPGTAHQQALQE